MAWVGVVLLGSTLLLGLLSATLGIDGLINRRGPRKRYVRILVYAAVLLAVAAVLSLRALQAWPGI